MVEVGKKLLANRPEAQNQARHPRRSGSGNRILSVYCPQHLQHATLEDIAILYRTNAQSLGFERLFPHYDIPYRIVGALRFYEREEIKDMLAFLAFLANPRDEVSFKRIVNKPARGIGTTSIEKIVASALQDGSDLLGASRKVIQEVHGKGKDGLRQFISLIGDAKTSLDKGVNDEGNLGMLGSLIADFAKNSGLIDFYRGKDKISGTQKEENIEELVNAASDSPLSEGGLLEFLDTVMLDQSQQRNDANADAVTLITMHNTKGLEFPVVIVTGLEQGLFPRNDEEGDDIEEQRRLFYVAVTRAKEQLYLTACRWRRLHGRLFETVPSRFLTEIDPELYELWGASGRTAQAAYTHRTPGREHYDTTTKAEWAPGMTVYHDEYGNGTVIKVTPSQSAGALVIVKFESGKVAQFFPKYTKKLEKVEH